MKRSIIALFFALCCSTFAQYYQIDMDSQAPGADIVLDRVFSGNTPYLKVNIYENQTVVALSNTWNGIYFSFGYDKYSTNGMVILTGTWTSTNVAVFTNTGTVFNREGTYYFSVWGTNSTTHAIKTFGRGKMIQEYDPAVASPANLTWWHTLNWDSIVNIGNYPWTNIAYSVYTATNDLTWTSDGTNITLTGYTGSQGAGIDIIIPSTIGGLPVTKAGSSFLSAVIAHDIIWTNLVTAGNTFLYRAKISGDIVLSAMTTAGNSFLTDATLNNFSAPVLTTAGNDFLSQATVLGSCYLPVFTTAGGDFLDAATLYDITLPLYTNAWAGVVTWQSSDFARTQDVWTTFVQTNDVALTNARPPEAHTQRWDTLTTGAATGMTSIAMDTCTASGNNGANANGAYTTASGDNGASANGVYAVASNDSSHVWSGQATLGNPYGSHGAGTENLDPIGGFAGMWIGQMTLADAFLWTSNDVNSAFQTTSNDVNSAFSQTSNDFALAVSNITPASIGAVSNTPAGIAAAGGMTNGQVLAASQYPLANTNDAGTLTGTLPSGVLGTNSDRTIGSLTVYRTVAAGTTNPPAGVYDARSSTSNQPVFYGYNSGGASSTSNLLFIGDPSGSFIVYGGGRVRASGYVDSQTGYFNTLIDNSSRNSVTLNNAARMILSSPHGTERMCVASNGCVGVGTNAPVASALLHVAGVIAVTSKTNHPAAYSGGGQLYCVSNEVYAMDSSGNFNVLSPDPDFADGKRIVQLSGNVYDNKPIEYVEAATLAAFLRGELKPDPALVRSVAKPAYMKRDWTADENAKVAAQNALIAAWQSDTNAVDVKGPKPEKYTPAPKPTWLIAAEQEQKK